MFKMKNSVASILCIVVLLNACRAGIVAPSNSYGCKNYSATNDCTDMDFSTDDSGIIVLKPGMSPEETNISDATPSTIATNENAENAANLDESDLSEKIDSSVDPKHNNSGGSTNNGGGNGGNDGSVIGNLIKGLTNGLGDLFGSSNKKRNNKEREIEAKANEARDIADKIDKLDKSIRDNYREDSEAIRSIFNGELFSSKDLQTHINIQGSDHNKSTNDLNNKIPDLDKDNPTTPVSPNNPGISCKDSADCTYKTPEQNRIRETRDYIAGAREYVGEHFTGADRATRERVLDVGDSLTDAASEFYKEGENDDADNALEVAKQLADMAVGAIPIVGDIMDIASAVAGQNIITGEELDDGQRIVQAAMAIGSLATGGTVHIIKDIANGGRIIKAAIKEKVKKELKSKAREEVQKEINRRQEPVDASIEDRSSANRGERTPGLGTPEGPIVEAGKQGKHQPGHNNYREGSSILEADPKELAKKAGTGVKAGNIEVGVPGSKERVVYDKVIGKYVDLQTGEAKPTNVGILHYSKNGIHIVPGRPNE